MDTGLRQHLDDLTHRVIGEAIHVRSRPGFGFSEKIHENALAMRLRREGIVAVQQRPVEVYFEEIARRA